MAQKAATRVLLATSLANDKAYVFDLLGKFVKRVKGVADVVCVLDDCKPPEAFYEGMPEGAKYIELGRPEWEPEFSERVWRVARVREETRQYFLKGDWTHLLFLDADIVAPPDGLKKLLDYPDELASGLYQIRGSGTPLLAVAGRTGNFTPSELLQTVPEGGFTTDGAGMGFMLIPRRALEAVGFKQTTDLTWGEDLQFCRDCLEQLQMPTRIVDDVSLWHVCEDRTAVAVVVGSLARGAVYDDISQSVRNNQGEWIRGIPRFDLTEDELADLPPGFVVGNFHKLEVERKKVEEVL